MYNHVQEEASARRQSATSGQLAFRFVLGQDRTPLNKLLCRKPAARELSHAVTRSASHGLEFEEGPQGRPWPLCCARETRRRGSDIHT